ncbi:cadherin domain-containing protein, partial [Microvirga solisilvae]|uniref:cadherin domain-containing protein n=1 Tax=Microvirga solisilvae TaxID=2919498 RepID=UPI0024341FDC
MTSPTSLDIFDASQPYEPQSVGATLAEPLTPVSWKTAMIASARLPSSVNGSPQWVTLQNGNIMAVWVSSGKVVGQVFNPDGTIAASDPIVIASSASGNAFNPMVTVLADGKIAVGWQYSIPLFSGGPLQHTMWVRTLAPDGTAYPAGHPNLASKSIASSSSTAWNQGAIIATDDGFVVSYGAVGGKTIFSAVHRVDDTGITLQKTTSLTGVTTTNVYEQPALAYLGGGVYVTVGVETTTNTNTAGTITAYLRDSAGNPYGLGKVSINAGVSANDSVNTLAVTKLQGQDAFAITWKDSTGIKVQVFNKDGSTKTTIKTVFANTFAATSPSPEIIALKDGGFAIAFQDSNGIYLAQYDALFNLVVAPVKIGSSPSDGKYSPTLNEMEDGRIVVGWVLDGASGTSTAYGQIFDPRIRSDSTVGIIWSDTKSEDDVFYGTKLGDTLNGGSGNDRLNGYDGHDEVHAGSGTNTVEGGLGNDTLVGGSGLDTLDGGAGTDTASYVDYESADGKTGLIINIADPTKNTGDAEGDTYISIEAWHGSNFNDTIEGTNLSTRDIINGGAGDDVLYGYGGNDSLTGGSGQDYLDGGVGADILVGEAGDDTFIIDDLGDTIVEITDEAGGRDTVILQGAAFGSSYALADGLENLTAGAGTGSMTLTGNNANNIIIGNTFDNTLEGGIGDDTLDGGGALSGADSLVGGVGNDTYHHRSVNDIIKESKDAEGGTADAVIIHESVLGPDRKFTAGSALEGIEIIKFAEDVTKGVWVVGHVQASTIEGTIYGDTLDGGGAASGKDVLKGGAGDDLYIVKNPGIIDIVETDGLVNGRDTVEIQGSEVTSYTLQDNVERLVAGKGTGIIELIGNSAANEIIGNAYENTLRGGAGGDTLDGGAGDDIYYVDAGDHIRDSSGYDIAYVNGSFSLDDDVMIEELIAESVGATIIGNNLANSITGSSGADVLKGGLNKAGLEGDTLDGGGGADVYIVSNSKDVIKDSGGFDTLILATNSYALKDGLEIEQIIVDSDKKAESFTITGNSYAQTISGGDNDDVITGGGGADMLIGGGGNDTYYISDAAAQISDTVGTNTVYTTVSYTLGGAANVELFQNQTSTGLEMVGNAFANSIVGGSGADTLDGGVGAGRDTLKGGDGGDTYVVRAGNTVIEESGGSGIDTIKAKVSYTLQSGVAVEILEVDTTVGIALTGNELANTLTSGAGSDTLDGGKGAGNRLTGGDGDDTFIIRNLDDVALEELNGGTNDTAIIKVRGYDLTKLKNIENIIFDYDPNPPSVTALAFDEHPDEGTLIGYIDLSELDDDIVGGPVLSGPLKDAVTLHKISATRYEVRVSASGKDLLNFESTASKVLKVKITNSFGNEATSDLTLDIRDVNEGPTDIRLNDAIGVEVEENTTVIGVLTATDPEGNAIVNYKIVGGDPEGFFTVFKNGDKFEIRVASDKKLDYEKLASHIFNLQIVGTDELGETTSTPETLTITVGDVDEAPEGLSLSAKTVIVNSPDEVVVGVLKGFDPEGNALSYTLAGALYDSGALTIAYSDFYSAWVLKVLNGSLITSDSDGKIVITASDGGKETSITVDLNILDKNTTPTNVRFAGSATIVDHAAEDKVVGILEVDDPDGQELTFSVWSSLGIDDVVRDYFYVVKNDWGQYELRVRKGTDSLIYNPSGDNTFKIYVTVSDGIDRSAETELTVTITENFGPTGIALDADLVDWRGNIVIPDDDDGTVIGLISASDPEGDAFTYSVEGTMAGIFDIKAGDEPGTWVLYVRDGSGLDLSTRTSLTVRIVATDKWGHASYQDVTLYTQALPPNRAPTDPTTSFDLEEGVTGEVLTLDDQDDDGETITYKFRWSDNSLHDTSEDGLFRFEGNKLVAVTAIDVGEDTLKSYIVVAGDGSGADNQYVEGTIDITIKYADETTGNHAPTDPTRAIEWLEGATGEVLTLPGIDVDEETITYKFKHSNGELSFTSEDGLFQFIGNKLYAIASADVNGDTPKTYDVVATDTAGAPNSTVTGTITITIKENGILPNKAPDDPSRSVDWGIGFEGEVIVLDDKDDDEQTITYKFKWADGTLHDESQDGLFKFVGNKMVTNNSSAFITEDVTKAYIVVADDGTTADNHSVTGVIKVSLKAEGASGNHSPTDPTRSIEWKEGELGLVLTLAATDLDGDTITYKFKWSDGTLHDVSQDGLFQFVNNQLTAIVASSVEWDITKTYDVVANDGSADFNNTTEGTITVTIKNVDEATGNHSPTDPTRSIEWSEGVLGEVMTLARVDIDGETITYRFKHSDGSLSNTSEDGLFKFVGNKMVAIATIDVTEDTPMSYAVVADDGTTASNHSTEGTITVVIKNVDEVTGNHAPADPSRSVEWSEGVLGVVLYLDSTDLDSQIISYRFKWSDNSLHDTSEDGLFKFVGNKLVALVAIDVGEDTLKSYVVVADDGTTADNHSVEGKIDITIKYADEATGNYAPTDPTRSVEWLEGALGEVLVLASTDRDEETITYKFKWSDNSLHDTSEDGLFQFVGNKMVAIGTSSVSVDTPFEYIVVADDGTTAANHQVEGTITVLIKENVPNRSPADPSRVVEIAEGTLGDVVTLALKDDDEETITYKFKWSDNSLHDT